MSVISETLSRRQALVAGVGVLAGFACADNPEAPGSKKQFPPNIVYIMADDLGYGDLGCYGQNDILTPNIDRLAQEGMRFTNHYSGSTVCAPSRCCLLTGYHTGHAYIRGNRQPNVEGQEPILPETVTIAELLKDAGYTNGVFGKWGLGGPDTLGIPTRQGFDSFYGYLCQGHAHNYWPEYLYRNEEKVYLEGNKVTANDRYAGAGVAYERVHYSADLIANEALSFIEQNSGNPFFLYFAPTIPHVNNEAGLEGLEVPSDEPYSSRDWPQQLKNYAAMVSRLDRDVGRIMSLLKHLGLDDNSIVIFTSDNGPEPPVHGFDPEYFNSSGPFRGMKTTMWEGGIRAPMIARWPGKIKAGTVNGHISANWDFFPTALELAKLPVKPDIDGISYLSALTGGVQKKHNHLYWEFQRGNKTYQAVRLDQWKGLRLGATEPLQLYDIVSDIAETTDLASKYPDIVRQIENIMISDRTESPFWPLL